MNKTILIFCIIITSIIKSFSQKLIVEKVIISKHKLNIGVIGIYNKPVIKSYDLNKKSFPIVTFLKSSVYRKEYPLPFCWSIDFDKKIVCVINSSISFVPNRGNRTMRIHRVKYGFADSSKYYIHDSLALSEFPKIKVDEKASKRIKRNNEESRKFLNSKHIEPIGELFDKYYKAQQEKEKKYGRIILPFLSNPFEMIDITYDFVWLHDNIFEFYVRDDKQITAWEFTYKVSKYSSKPEDWQEIKTWTTQEKGSYPTQEENPFLPSGKNHVYKAFHDTITNIMLNDTSMNTLQEALPDSVIQKLQTIKGKAFTNDEMFSQTLDTLLGKEQTREYKKQIKNSGRYLFFKGFLEVVKQNGNTYIINRHYGGIYHVSKTQITRVGQIDMENYTRKLRGKTVFVEDRDSNRLLFFAPVKQLTKSAPFPNIKVVLNDKKFRRMFKYIIE